MNRLNPVVSRAQATMARDGKRYVCLVSLPEAESLDDDPKNKGLVLPIPVTDQNQSDILLLQINWLLDNARVELHPK